VKVRAFPGIRLELWLRGGIRPNNIRGSYWLCYAKTIQPRIAGRVLSPTRSGVLVQRATNPRRLPTWSLRAFTEAAASIATLYRQIVKLARDRGEQAPSYGTVFNIVRSLPADLVTLAHEGTKAYSNTFELVHRREAERPNSIWQAEPTRRSTSYSFDQMAGMQSPASQP
jgi:hypothetical protein